VPKCRSNEPDQGLTLRRGKIYRTQEATQSDEKEKSCVSAGTKSAGILPSTDSVTEDKASEDNKREIARLTSPPLPDSAVKKDTWRCAGQAPTVP
jgi:hypothetical protein